MPGRNGIYEARARAGAGCLYGEYADGALPRIRGLEVGLLLFIIRTANTTTPLTRPNFPRANERETRGELGLSVSVFLCLQVGTRGPLVGGIGEARNAPEASHPKLTMDASILVNVQAHAVQQNIQRVQRLPSTRPGETVRCDVYEQGTFHLEWVARFETDDFDLRRMHDIFKRGGPMAMPIADPTSRPWHFLLNWFFCGDLAFHSRARSGTARSEFPRTVLSMRYKARSTVSASFGNARMPTAMSNLLSTKHFLLN